MRYLILYATNNGDDRAHMCELPDDTDMELASVSTFGLQVGEGGDEANAEAAWYIIEMPEDADPNDRFRPLVLNGGGEEVPMTFGAFHL